jgi:error-prone DNA polymerase
MVAAGFSPGEADRLRRSMAAWRRRGGLAPFQQRLIHGMRARGYSEDFAQRIFQQILGFGEYGFPESHAASFSLLAYVSAWLKRHEPAAFTAALLNSQPMGFYAPAQLVQDARSHGVAVRSADVAHSHWDCTLETDPEPRTANAGSPALRLGLRMVKGLSRAGAERLVAARDRAPFVDVEDLARRARLDQRDLAALAGAGALTGLAGHRHQARWAVAGVEPRLPLFEQDGNRAPGAAGSEGRGPGAAKETIPLLRAPSEGEDIVADYASLGLTLGRHPLALLRPQLARRGVAPAREVYGHAHGDAVHTAGLVTCRQHPASASGVVFLTLEDETGACQLIVWPHVAQRRRKALITSSLLGVVGEVQREGEVLHVIAKDLIDYSVLLGALVTRSRDFH